MVYDVFRAVLSRVDLCVAQSSVDLCIAQSSVDLCVAQSSVDLCVAQSSVDLCIAQFWFNINIMKPLSNNYRGLMLGHVSRPHAIKER